MTRIELKVGDTIVVTTPYNLSPDDANALKNKMMEKFPDHKVVVMTGGLTLGVIGRAS